ncbi:hypothetical protein ABNF97_33540, partial [Plantactinospora sp. B6F1]
WDRWAGPPAGWDRWAGPPAGWDRWAGPPAGWDRWAGPPAGWDRWAGPPAGWDAAAAGRLLTERVLTADRLPVKAMLTAGTLLPKQRTGCADINKYYLRTGPNYLRSDR